MASKGATALALAALFLFLTLATTARASCPTTPAPAASPIISPRHAPSPTKSSSSCPINALKLGVCTDLLSGLLNLNLGAPPKKPCCSLIRGLADLEAALCLCTALKADLLGLINLDLPVNLSLLVNYCGKKVPAGFQCQ